MLDLDILLKYYAQISHVRAIKQSDIADIHTDPVAFYTEKLAVAGSAGYTITDEFLFCGKIPYCHLVSLFFWPFGLLCDQSLKYRSRV